ncbi:FABP family protein [Mobilicoccus massiliensis]|uniref:FABP family protein n=1 Tax=Mobilicoccus massiliensis TaxID=1522310 RepID=UPI00058F389E|nr:FABP family protein [Mobilicoccus massiliensis]
MPFELDPTINPVVAPLAWMVGRWEGVGVVGYPDMESRNFGQELDITHDGRPFLAYESRSYLLNEDGSKDRESGRETGYLRVLNSGEIELLLAHPTGIVELYAGEREEERPVLNLRTDGVMRSPEARDYTAASRMYGLVDRKLMWVMDMAAEGHPMQSHLSAQLNRVG